MGPQYIKGGIARLDCIVTVVDALRMKDEFGNGDNLQRGNLEEDDLENLVIQQLEFCNIILLNKASEVTPSELDHVTQIIRAIQPKAEIIPCDYGDIELERILDTRRFNFDDVATSAAWIDQIEHHHGEPDDDDEAEEEHHITMTSMSTTTTMSIIMMTSTSTATTTIMTTTTTATAITTITTMSMARSRSTV